MAAVAAKCDPLDSRFCLRRVPLSGQVSRAPGWSSGDMLAACSACSSGTPAGPVLTLGWPSRAFCECSVAEGRQSGLLCTFARVPRGRALQRQVQLIPLVDEAECAGACSWKYTVAGTNETKVFNGTCDNPSAPPRRPHVPALHATRCRPCAGRHAPRARPAHPWTTLPGRVSDLAGSWQVRHGSASGAPARRRPADGALVLRGPRQLPQPALRGLDRRHIRRVRRHEGHHHV